MTWCSRLIYILAINLVLGQENIKIIVLTENGQNDTTVHWYRSASKTTNPSIRFESMLLEVDADDDSTKIKICAAVSEGGVFILDLTWSINDMAKSLSNDTGIPYLRIDTSVAPFLEFLDTYLMFRNSTDVAVIFGDSQVIDQALYYWINFPKIQLLISEALDDISVKKLKSVRPIPHTFAIVANMQNMEKIFKNALNGNLLSLPERWNLIFTDFRYNEGNKVHLNSLPVHQLIPDPIICCHLLNITRSCQCPDNFNTQKQFLNYSVQYVLQSIERTVKEGYKFSDKVVCNGMKFNEQTRRRYDDILEKSIKDDKLIVLEDRNLKLRLTGSVLIGSNDTVIESIARFEDGSIILLENKTLNPIRNFFRIGITHALPWSYKVEDPITGTMNWTGYCVDFAYKMAEMMDFDFEFVEPKSGTFGEKINGVWDGVVGDLAKGDTDLAVTAIIMTADKEEVIDFVAPYFEQTGITIVMRKPVRKTSLFKFMTVLKLEVWLSIVAALIVTGFMVWFLDKYSPYSARNNRKAYPYACREFTLKESFWFALTSFTPQGGGEAPKALSGRTLVAAYWLFVVLMLATFTANLAAFLTVERMQAPVQSLEQLARQSRINYTVVKDSETHKYFINMKNAEDTLYRMWKELTLNASIDETKYRVWDYPIREQYGHILLAINDSNPVSTAEEGFRKVDEHLDADYAFIHDSSEIKYEISRNCNLTEVGEIFAEKPYAVAVQQGSSLQDEISKTILKLQKDRFFEGLQAKYWNHSTKGNCPSTDDNEGITLESLGGVFIATLFGLALAMITLAGEVLYYRRKRKLMEEKERLAGKPHGLPNKLIPPTKLFDSSKPATITLGSTFRPVNLKDKMQKERDELKISHINLYPRARNRITQVDN